MSEPICEGLAPTDVASEYGLAQFIVIIVVLVFTIVTSALTLYMRSYRRRLRVRSLLPILLGSTAGMVFMLVRGVYDLIGIEYFPCSLNAAMYYWFPSFIFVTDSVSIISFLSKQYKRKALNANTIIALNKLAEERELDNRPTTVREYLQGLWNYLLGLAEVVSLTGRFNERVWYKTSRLKMSIARELSYEVVAAIVLSVPYIVAWIVRVATFPVYQPSSGCTGCLLEWEDFVTVTSITLVLGIPTSVMVYRVRKRNLPDPLFYLFDIELSVAIMSPLAVICGVLFSVDPGGLMRAQKVDWFIFEMTSIFYIHCMRTVVQLARTNKMHRLGEAHLRLLDILSDANGALLFEKHLIAELANENLLFWREAIKYKLQFDKNRDFAVSQETAKVIYRTFIARSAVFPINIGSDIKRGIEARFKGAVGRNVFDDALIEVYKMMQDGAFKRFVTSPAFKEYSKTRADFSMSSLGVFNPMSVLPDDTASQRASGAGTTDPTVSVAKSHLNIKDYVQSL